MPRNNLIKQFPQWSYPVSPLQRKLSEDEERKLTNNFPQHSFHRYVDKEGNIILGNGIDEGGMFYITETDLNSL